MALTQTSPPIPSPARTPRGLQAVSYVKKVQVQIQVQVHVQVRVVASCKLQDRQTTQYLTIAKVANRILNQRLAIPLVKHQYHVNLHCIMLMSLQK